MFVVDTNVLIYAADSAAPAHPRCRALIDRWRQGTAAWFVTWGICYEFLRVVTHPRVLRRPWSASAAHDFVDALAAAPSLSVLMPTDRHSEVLRDVVSAVPGMAGNLWHDAHTATLMREHGIRRICTRDTDFQRFAWVEAIDPMVSEP